jgi:hypothetical protein
VGHATYTGKKKSAYRPFVGQISRKRQLERPRVSLQERLLLIGVLKKQSVMA